MAALPSFARADGDPASDYLVARQVFLSSQPTWSQASQHELLNVVAAANRAGFPIRVAIISSDYDLGSITALWRKPRIYARFLGLELALAYKQRLLVIMPNGFGFSWPQHPVGPTYRLLAKIPIPSAAAGSLDAARTAVRQLAAAAGVTVPTVTNGANKRNPSRDRWAQQRSCGVHRGWSGCSRRWTRWCCLRWAGVGAPAPRSRATRRSRARPAVPTRGWVLPGFALLIVVAVGSPILALSIFRHARRFGQLRGSGRDVASVHLARGPPAGA